MNDKNNNSDMIADQIRKLGNIIGTMIVTRTCYEHDGLDTTNYDNDILKLRDQLKTMVKLQRSYLNRKIKE